MTAQELNRFIPRIWADTLEANLKRRVILGWDYMQKEMEERRARMTEQERAEEEAWSYWDALYENQRVYEEEDEW